MVVEPEDLAGDLEQALPDPLERQVLGDLVLVDPVAGELLGAVVVRPVPALQRPLDPVGGHHAAELVGLRRRGRANGRDELVIEFRDTVRVAAHPYLGRDVRPGRVPEERRHLAAQCERLGQKRPVRLHGLVPVLAEQRLAQVATGAALEEWGELRVVEADAQRAGPLARLEPLDVRVRHAGQLLAGDLDPVGELADVPLERHLELDEPRAERLELAALRGAQLLSGAAEVAQPEVEQAAILAVECRAGGGVGESPHRRVEIVAEREPHPPLRDPLLRLAAGVAHRRVGRDLRHEGTTSIAGADGRVGELDRYQGVGQGRGGDGCHRPRDVLLGRRQGGIGLFGDARRGDGTVVVGHDAADGTARGGAAIGPQVRRRGGPVSRRRRRDWWR